MTSDDIEIREATVRPHPFFRDITDVTDLDTDPWDTCVEAIVDDEVVGLLAVEEFARTSLVRLAVKEDYRRQGVATALVKHAQETYDEFIAYVDEDNDACRKLLESVECVEGGYAPPNLVCYNWGDAIENRIDEKTNV